MPIVAAVQHRAGLFGVGLFALAGCVAQDGADARPSPPVPIVTISAALPQAPAERSHAAAMVVAAHPLAAAAGLAMLARGGAPIDAAVAAQAVLGLVEPQHSGFGGGSVLLTWQAPKAGGKPVLTVFDGTPRAGRDAPRGLNTDAAGNPLDPALTAHGGSAVGIPGTLPVLFAAHAAQGKLPWAELFAPAITLAEDGFPMPRSLHDLLMESGAAESYAEVAAPYLAPDGSVLPVGTVLRHPAYAAALRRVAAGGPAGLYDGDAMTVMLAALHRGARASPLTADDLRSYTPAQAPPLCMAWHAWRVCTAPPPAYGGLVALQTLALAGDGDLDQPAYAHTFLEAGRLAQADRRRFIGDPDYVGLPGGLLDPGYLTQRSALIAPDHAMGRPRAGEPPDSDAADQSNGGDAGLRADPGAPSTATTQIAVADRGGNVLTMTSTLTHVFGARLAAGGVVLNNTLVNFAPLPPVDAHYANEMAPGKRPAGPAAPVIVFGPDGRPLLVGGSGGGPGVPDFVAAALLDILVHHRPPAEAVARPHLTAADPDHVAVEAATPAEALLPALTAMGHQAFAEPLPSGSAFLLRTPDGWVGAADPRRDGVALGE